MYCRPSPRRPAATRPASSPARSLLACNLAVRRDCSHTWPSHFARLPLPRTYWSGRTTADRIPRQTNLSTFVVSARTGLACVSTLGPATGTAGLFPPPQTPAPPPLPPPPDLTFPHP